jgi:hypothetical protein
MEKQEWLDKLVEGDKVIVEYKVGGFERGYKKLVAIVEKITPTRQIKVDAFKERFRDGEYYKADKYTSTRRVLHECTPEAEKEVTETHLKDAFAIQLQKVDFRKLSYSQLNRIVEITKEPVGEDNLIINQLVSEIKQMTDVEREHEGWEDFADKEAMVLVLSNRTKLYAASYGCGPGNITGIDKNGNGIVVYAYSKEEEEHGN